MPSPDRSTAWLRALVAAAGLAAAGTAFAASKAAAPPASSTGSPEDARIDAFWAWWKDASPRLAAAFDSRLQGAPIVGELSDRVHAVDPHLAWEAGPGLKGAKLQLVLSSEGDPALRVLAERWLSRAPPPDATWEFYPARQAIPAARLAGFELKFDDAPGALDLGHARVALQPDEAREVVHVTFHHPGFAKLSDEQRTRAAFIVLDQVLGEDGVERWVGGVRTAAEPLADGKPLEALSAAVAALAKKATGERFALVEGRTSSGAPLVALVNVSLKRIDHLLLDHHLAVTVPLRGDLARGMPSPAENAAQNALEDELLGALGRDAVYVGHETGDGQRVIHLHVSNQGPAEARARSWARAHQDRRIAVEVRPDPAWDVLQRWR